MRVTITQYNSIFIIGGTKMQVYLQIYFFPILLLLVFIIAAFSIIIVPQGYQYTLERFGKCVGSLKAGFHIIMPFVYRIGKKVNMMECVIDVPSQEIITKDNAMVKVDGVVFFQIMDAIKATYMVNKYIMQSLI